MWVVWKIAGSFGKLPSTSQGKKTEINHVTDALRVNNYPSYVISNILKRKFSKLPALAIVVKTLQQEFPSPKFRPSIERQPNVVYKIPCADCDWCYVCETGRCFETRKKEHIRNVITCANDQTLRNMRGHSTIA